MKQKLKSYNFWISLTSVAILFVRLIGEKFGFTINESDFMDIMVVLCTVFAILGIFEVPKNSLSATNESLFENIKTSIEQVKNFVSGGANDENSCKTKEQGETLDNSITNYLTFFKNEINSALAETKALQEQLIENFNTLGGKTMENFEEIAIEVKDAENVDASDAIVEATGETPANDAMGVVETIAETPCVEFDETAETPCVECDEICETEVFYANPVDVQTEVVESIIKTTEIGTETAETQIAIEPPQVF